MFDVLYGTVLRKCVCHLVIYITNTLFGNIIRVEGEKKMEKKKLYTLLVLSAPNSKPKVKVSSRGTY